MNYLANIFVIYFFIVIPIFLIISAIKWFFITKKINNKLNQSFPPLVYSILWLIPFINLFIVWITLENAWNKGVISKEKTLSKYGFSIIMPLVLTYGSYGIIFIPLTIIGTLLMISFPSVGEMLLQTTPFIAVIISIIYFIKLLKNLKVFEKEILN